MLLPDAREAIVTTCQELSRTGLVVGRRATPRLLSPAEIAAVAVKLEGYGQQPPVA
jgi:hypothetical protein